MALADTSKAIGAVTKGLKERLEFRTGYHVSAGRIEKPNLTIDEAYLNLFLYEIAFDPQLKNTPLNEGEKPPIWLVLKFLLTAFASKTESDTQAAHEILGLAIRAIYQDDLLKLNGLGDVKPLESNPSELHVTFEESPADLVAKLTQGSDETPRLSIAFQVRPVMIASAEPGHYSLLVGVDYTKPPITLSPAPVGLDVIPSMGSFITEIVPSGFEVNEEITLRGTDLHLANLSVMLGSVELPITMQQPDELKFKIDSAIIAASGLSAGSYSVMIVQTLPGTGKKRKSNALIGNLVPTLLNAPIAAFSLMVIPAIPPSSFDTAYATINLNGILLGNKNDDVILALYRDGKVYQSFDVFSVLPVPQPPLQPAQQLKMIAKDAVPVGDYQAILLVNGQQAPQSPIISLHNP